MTLAIFDLDNTLLDGDSDYLWGEYMVANGLVDEKKYRARNQLFFEDYQRGELDNEVYLQFALEPLTKFTLDELFSWRKDYVENWIKPRVGHGIAKLLKFHRDQQHNLMIISATHLFITEPIAQMLEIPVILATEPEIIDQRYSGKYIGVATFKEGKVEALELWMLQNQKNLEGSYFYSDSINDIALLEAVEVPIVVRPDDSLKKLAQDRGWEIIDPLTKPKVISD